MSENSCSACRVAEQFLPLNLQYRAIGSCGRGCGAQGLIRGDASLAHEIAGAEQRDGCFLALFGQHAEPDPPLLDIEDCVRTLSLGKDHLLRAVVTKSPADASSR